VGAALIGPAVSMVSPSAVATALRRRSRDVMEFLLPAPPPL